MDLHNHTRKIKIYSVELALQNQFPLNQNVRIISLNPPNIEFMLKRLLINLLQKSSF